jgi:hypothetical protein
MSYIDFREIPAAHLNTGDQDLFELFARDFFEALGFKIIEGPGRGIDRGRDLIIAESVSGTLSKQEKKWLVSIKHKAHSGNSVSDQDELDPIGRVRKHKADGFIGFYSTLPSSGLDDTFSRIKSDVDVYCYDRARIEECLLTRLELASVCQRYFPESYKKWSDRDRQAVLLFDEISPLECCACEKNILLEEGNIVFVQTVDNETAVSTILDLYWACKGDCDDSLVRDATLKFSPKIITTSWEDIDDLRIPLLFVRWIMTFLNQLRKANVIYSDTAFAKHRQFILLLSQVVLKPTSAERMDRLKLLLEFGL